MWILKILSVSYECEEAKAWTVTV